MRTFAQIFFPVFLLGNRESHPVILKGGAKPSFLFRNWRRRDCLTEGKIVVGKEKLSCSTSKKSSSTEKREISQEAEKEGEKFNFV